MFRSLCGDDVLSNVRVITTNWNRVSEQEGQDRAEALSNEAFKPLLDAGAKMLRHDNNLSSASKIMSELIPLPSISTQFERELLVGKKLNETAAGSVLTEEMALIQKRHAQDLADLRKEMQEALKANDDSWKEDLERERNKLQQKMADVENERRELEKRVGDLQANVARLQSDLDNKPGCIMM
jgi:phage-related minor tail protein